MATSNINKAKIRSKNLFPVVGVGASAGGLDAFKKLIRAIPEHSGIAYILVQHLHPDHSSSLPDILQRETTIPVEQISDNVKVEPDHVYIIPSNKMLVATDGILQLSPRPSKGHRNMPIDIFFSSLAEVHQSHAIGVVLSGSGADGTLGLKEIKDHGGITFAQDLHTAGYDSMPQSAIKAGVVDFILSPEEMPDQLKKLSETYNILPSSEHAVPKEPAEEESFKQVLALIRSNSGVDFTYYKQTTVRRRILRRMAILKLEKIADYQAYLKKNKAELDILFQDMLIPVTSFFRDPVIFDHVCKTVLPQLIKDKSLGNPLRIWVAGCSTGQEAYSIGMGLHEALSDKISNFRIQIFATDVSENSILKARAGVYKKSEMEGLSEQRIQNFFTKVNGDYQVRKTIRDMCIFATHNFLKDPPFAKIDLISCRNVLIYLEPFLQKRAFAVFHYALNPQGYLWLGKSESVGSSSEYFLPLALKDKLYTKKSFPGRFMSVTSESREEPLIDKDAGLPKTERKKDDFQKDAEQVLLTKYTPPGVIVNDQYDIVQFRGSTGNFLEPSPGKASLNVLKMAREGLAFELRNALQKAKTTRTAFTKKGISINQGKGEVCIEVVPLLNSIEPYFLILFKDTTPERPYDGNKVPTAADLKTEKDTRIQHLEEDLLQVREDMRSVTEEQEAVNEELQSANEELLSGSEELQSLNEELETSKEELQSTNEELITVNQELYDRNEQYNEARLYAEAIVSTIHEPLMVIDNDFKIKSANKSFYKNFHLTEEETVGQVIFDLQNKSWNIPELRSKLLKIQKGQEKFIEWEVCHTFPAIGTRYICINAQPVQKEIRANWILLAFDDITARIEAEKQDRKNLSDVKKILENIPQITSTASADGAVNYFNQFFLDYSGLTFDEAIGWGWERTIQPEMLDEVKKQWAHSVKTGEDFKMELLFKRKSDNMYRWHLSKATPILNDEGKVASWVGAAIDIHEQKTKEQVKDEFIGIASHELKTPLTTAKAYIQLLEMGLAETKDKDLIFAQKASASITRLNDLIGELMDVSKIQNGKLDLQITAFDFNEMVTDATEQVQYGSPGHHIKLSGKIKNPVKGDKNRLQQVVINLLSNAVKYSPKSKEVFIHLSAKAGEVKVAIKDTGIGIRKQSLDKIFDRYYREEQRAVHFQGLGIGLFISHEIIVRHHGKIWAESEPGEGSTFYFTIPLSQ
ncbi:PAS domain S-box protein [Ginsengibacter hankyongi]|uniref:PAS domain S-box protein n=2 Tax=Ginsengibacter hankyongi TaxID=2607284 RepID=A0A5J5IND3_9BACT|nr:PAS domain S-box protein [Ginsengibacter hankyongi]